MSRHGHRIAAFSALLALLALLASTSPTVGGSAEPPKIPAVVEVEAAPSPADRGGALSVQVRLTPIEGVKLNMYPKLALDVPAVAGLVGAARVEIGNDAPPRPGTDGDNYWDGDSVTVRLDVPVESAAAAGEHRVPGRLRYFYCVTASGFCSRETVDVVIPLTVR